MGSCVVVHHDTIYMCLSNLWIDRRAISTDLQSAFQGVEIMVYLMDHEQLRSLAIQMGINARSQKMAIAYDIVSMMWNIWHMSKNKKKIAALDALKRNFRMRNQPINTTDPFTIEAIGDLPTEEIFRFREGGRVYAVHGPSFYEYVYVHDQETNPLTRTTITLATRQRLLCAHGQQWAIPVQDDETDRGTSPSLAFTEVASELEHLHGIHMQPAWIAAFTEFDIRGIFTNFHTRSHQNTPYMTPNAGLADELLYLIRSEFAPSTHVAAAVCAMAAFCEPLRASLPDWIYDASVGIHV